MGLGVLIDLVRSEAPLVVFFIETKLTAKKMELVNKKLRFDECFEVDCFRRSGGLALLWREEVIL